MRQGDKERRPSLPSSGINKEADTKQEAMVKERVGGLAWIRKQVEAADKDLLREIVKGMVEAPL